MSEDELSTHLREDYREASQEWPDYLDYIEEWEYSYKSTLIQTRKDFIFTALAKKHQKIICGDHHHVFSTQDVPGVIFLPNPDCYMDYDTCWYKTITESDEVLRANDTSIEAPRLSQPESLVIKNLTKMRLMLGESTTFDKLSFSDFKTKWWSQESRDQARKIFLDSRTPPAPTPDSIIAEAIKESPAPEPKWLSMECEKEVIFNNEKVAGIHGLHSLLRVREDRHTILDMINNIRSTAQLYTGPITRQQIAESMKECYHCSLYTGTPSSVSYPGVYYSPPGNGKTTIQRQELFIGLDTDLLITMSDYKTIIDPFLRIGIPIITNQYHLCQNSGEKFIGSFSKDHLRRDDLGNAFTTLKEIVSAKETFNDDLFLMFTDTYLDKSLLTLLRVNFIYNYTRNKVMLRDRVKVTQMPKQDQHFASVAEVVENFKHWSSKSEGTKHRSRRKAHHRLDNG